MLGLRAESQSPHVPRWGSGTLPCLFLTAPSAGPDPRPSPQVRSHRGHHASETKERGCPPTHRLAGVNVGEVRLQPAHGPVQKAVDGLVGVLLVGRLDDEGHRVAHHALLHAAGPAPLPPPGTRSRSEPRALGMGSARGAELPQATGGAHPRAGRAGRGAARRGTRGPPTANRHAPTLGKPPPAPTGKPELSRTTPPRPTARRCLCKMEAGSAASLLRLLLLLLLPRRSPRRTLRGARRPRGRLALRRRAATCRRAAGTGGRCDVTWRLWGREVSVWAEPPCSVRCLRHCSVAGMSSCDSFYMKGHCCYLGQNSKRLVKTL